MTHDISRLQVTMEQMDRLIRALEDLQDNVLPKNPRLFAVLAEAPLEDLRRLRTEVSDLAHELQPTA